MSSRPHIGTLFRLSLASGVAAAVAMHVRRGAPVNGRDSVGRTPLILAAGRGHAEVCDVLLAAGADCGLVDEMGRSALDAARIHGHSAVALRIERHLASRMAIQPERDVPVMASPGDQGSDHPVATLSESLWRPEPDCAVPDSDSEVAPADTHIVETSPSRKAAISEYLDLGATDAVFVKAADYGSVHRVETVSVPSPDPSPLVVEPDTSDWIPENETDFGPDDGSITAAAGRIDRIATEHRPVIDDEVWSDVAIDLPDIAESWTVAYADDPEALSGIRELIVHGLSSGWVCRDELEALADLARPGTAATDLIRRLQVTLGDAGVIILDGDPTVPMRPVCEWLSRKEDRFAAGDEFRATWEFLGRLSDDSLDEIALLEKQARNAAILTPEEEGELFVTSYSAQRTMLAGVAAHGAVPDVLREWAERLDAGILSARDVLNGDPVGRRPAHQIGTDTIGIRQSDVPAADNGESSADQDNSLETDHWFDLSAASLLRQTADRLSAVNRSSGSDDLCRDALLALQLTSLRIAELAQRVLSHDFPQYSRRITARVRRNRAVGDLRLLQKRNLSTTMVEGPMTVLASALADWNEARTRIVVGNLRRVVWNARRYGRGGVPFLDLVQEGQLGLLRAIERFDHARGWRFGTYAHWWIRQGMTRAIQDQSRAVRIPVHMLERLTKVQRIIEGFQVRFGREPDVKEIAFHLAISPEAVRNIMRARLEEICSDDVVLSLGSMEGEPPIGLADSLVDETSQSPLSTLLHADLRRCLKISLQQLGTRERQILQLRFGIDDGRPHTLEEVGQTYGVTRERIRQIESKAIKDLRRKLPDRRIENMAP